MKVTNTEESITFHYNYNKADDTDVLFEAQQKELTDALHAALVDAGITKGKVTIDY